VSFSANDPIIGTSRGSADEAKAFAKNAGAANLEAVNAYIDEVYRLCGPDDMPDAGIVIAQSVHETTDQGRPWFSYWWRQRLNPAGIGITGDTNQNNASHTFGSGAEAAQAQVAHLLLYATGNIDRGGLVPAADPRYDAYVEAFGHTAQATRIGDLGSGRWAADPNYAAGIVDKGNAVFPDAPDAKLPKGTVIFGRVPLPPMEIRDIPSRDNTAWDDLGQRTVRAICWHRSLGSHQGNDQFFRQQANAQQTRQGALTDYGIGVAAQDGNALAGVIYRWNDPKGRRSPWANGPVSGAYGDGAKFVDRYGINTVNRDCTSVEVSGFQTTPLDEKSRQALCALTAYWADQYGVSWETFPLIPSEGNRSFVIWHQEFTIGTGKECPFQVVIDETNALIERTRAILKQHQVVADPTPAPKPKPEPKPTPAPQPGDDHPPLPAGLSQGVLEALFNPNGVKKPDGGNVGFNWNGAVSRAWFDQAVAAIPEGGDWKQGNFTPLVAVIKRGDGRLVFEFADWIYEAAA
jgi:hypothetical protein